jgi:hypothetical protein
MNTFTNTVAAAEFFLSINGFAVPTVIKPVMPDPALNNPIKKVSSIDPLLLAAQSSVASVNSEIFRFVEATRQTTESEKIIGELRQWQFLDEDWDGEGASKPLLTSINAAVQFINLIKPEAQLPEPMIHASGFTSLLWDRDDFYAEIQFISNNKIAYFVKNHEGKRYKGTIEFDTKQIPLAISDLIEV